LSEVLFQNNLLENQDWNFNENSSSNNSSIHPYPAKFISEIPQMLMTALPLPKGTTVLDPFCGSGTTITECTHKGIHSTGFDINPLAVYITNTKLKALSISAKSIKNTGEEIIKQYKIEKSKKHEGLSQAS